MILEDIIETLFVEPLKAVIVAIAFLAVTSAFGIQYLDNSILFIIFGIPTILSLFPLLIAGVCFLGRIVN